MSGGTGHAPAASPFTVARPAIRRGRSRCTGRAAPGTIVVSGQAPMSELLGYQNRLNALTSGQGRYQVEFSHYEPVPPNTQQQLVEGFRSRDAE